MRRARQGDMTQTMDIPRCPVAAYQLATEGQTVQRSYCRMGQDYDCRCTYCSHSSYEAACKKAAEWNAATAGHRAWVASVAGALQCLAVIGRAMALVASMPVAIGTFAQHAAHVFYRIPCKGATYRVVGKMGNAKNHQGVVGVCRFIDESVYNARPANWRGRWTDDRKPTIKVGLAVQGQERLTFVAFSQVERIPESLDVIAAKLEREIVRITLNEGGVRPRWTGTVPSRRSKKSQPIAYVVSGRNRGLSGHVFWIGSDRRTGEDNARMGIRCIETGANLWESVYDCRNEAPMSEKSPAERELIERIAADAVGSDKKDLARELLAQI